MYSRTVKSSAPYLMLCALFLAQPVYALQDVSQADAAVAGDGQWFILDDGSQNASIGMNNNGSQMRASVWLNRFTTSSALTLDAISIHWPSGLTGLTINLVAYYDADGDGDPSDSQRLGTNMLVQIATQSAFQTWTVNFQVPGAGDFYVGFVDHWAMAGSSPVRFPAAADTTAPQVRSYVAFTRGSEGVTDINQLGSNTNIGTLQQILPSNPSLHGNLMIRAHSTSAPAADCIYANGFDGATNGCFM